MLEGPNSPEPPIGHERTDAEVARYLLARCRELQRLTDDLNNPEITRLICEAIDKTQEVLDADGQNNS